MTLYRCPYCPLIHLHEADHTRHMADHADPVWVAEQAEWLLVARRNVAALNERRRRNDE